MSIITTPTCFKTVTPTCIDLILTNHKQNFMKSQALVTRISDFHAHTLTIMRNTFCKGNPKSKDFKNFDHEMFEHELLIPYSHFNR